MKTSTVMSFRLDHETRRTIARLARTRRRSRSEVVREAVAALIEHAPQHDRPYDAWASAIGIARGGRRDLSEGTGRHLRRLLSTRAER